MASSWLDMSNWTQGKVTFANAIGLGKYVKYQSLSPVLPAASQAATPTTPGSTSGTSTSAAPSSAGSAATPSNSSEDAFWKAVLATLGAPATSANINSLNAWAQKESIWPGGPNKGGLYNPLNTTLSQPGATNYNSVGVKNFVSAASGVVATAQTLLGGYPQIVALLKNGGGLCGTDAGGEFAKWSGDGYTSVC